jgi:hypothetical protein
MARTRRHSTALTLGVSLGLCYSAGLRLQHEHSVVLHHNDRGGVVSVRGPTRQTYEGIDTVYTTVRWMKGRMDDRETDGERCGTHQRLNTVERHGDPETLQRLAVGALHAAQRRLHTLKGGGQGEEGRHQRR